MSSMKTKTELPRKVELYLQCRHYAVSTTEAYKKWALRFLVFCGEDELTPKKAEMFLTSLASSVSRQTQRQAFFALKLLFESILEQPFAGVKATRAPKSNFVAAILTADELTNFFEALSGTKRLMAEFQYGTGMRVSEMARLRIKDIDFGNGAVIVRDSKGGGDRKTILPTGLIPSLKAQIEQARIIQKNDIADGRGGVLLSPALLRKFSNASKDLAWQFLFPGNALVNQNNKIYRNHISISGIQRFVKRAASRAGINKRVTSHTLRHCFATDLANNGTSLRDIQELLGHATLEMTMTYVHSFKAFPRVITSPLDRLKREQAGLT